MYLFDTFTNFLSGLGVAGRDKMTGHRYVKQLWTRDQLEASFQSDWIARKAIVIPAQDSVREWRAWQAEQAQIELLEATEKRLLIQQKLQEALVKARLYGGSCILIGVDGDMTKELDPETIKKDALKFVHVFAPHQLAPQEIIKDISDPYYGQPSFYGLNDNTGKVGDVMIHPSRMVRLIGLDSPDPMANFGWGDPLLQVIHDAVASAGTVLQSVSTLISEAKIDVIKIPGLTEIFATTDGTQRMIKRFTEANIAKSVVNSILIDGEEEWQRIQVQFRGMPEVLQMYLQVAAGAADIPMTRFIGMSPGGLNATGDSDLANYYNRIGSDQELRLTPALEKLDKAIQRSALGKTDANIFYEWNSLWEVSDAEKAAIALSKAQATALDVNSGLVPFDALSKGRNNQLIEDGTYPGLEAALEESEIDEDMIAEHTLAKHEQALLPPPSGMGGQVDEEDVEDSIDEDDDSTPGRLRRAIFYMNDALRAWNEEQHSRGQPENAGQFGPGGYGSKAKKSGKARVRKATANARTASKRAKGHIEGRRGEATSIANEGNAGGLRAAARGEAETAAMVLASAATTPVNEEALHLNPKLPKTYTFVSPNVKHGLTMKGASMELESRQQSMLRAASDDIDNRLGMTETKDVNIIGVWVDPTKGPQPENSMMTVSDEDDWDKAVLGAAMKGHLQDQKAILVFQEQEGGKQALVHFDLVGKNIETLSKKLGRVGLSNHTLVPTSTGARVYVADMDGSLKDAIEKGAAISGKDNPITIQYGRGQFIGDVKDDAGDDAESGSEREQRDRARRVYEGYIERSKVAGSEAIWEDVHDTWGAPTDSPGYALTANAILADQTQAIKPNSVLLGDAALAINDRAGEILQRDLQVDHLDIDNRTPERDHYIADVIVADLKNELKTGQSGEDWYDDTMRDAMEVAEAIYPGVSTDENAKFAYTAALSITSQGEVVDRSTDLADQAYSYFLEHGRYPELEASDPNIGGNLVKMNKLIDKYGVDGTRRFFEKQMTVAELEKETGMSVSGMNKPDVVYGSAVLGAKIGQGFYQNLNGNFTPITMDMWFMRSWGRVTNTGVERTEFTPQLDTLDKALESAGLPVPGTREAKIKLAHEISDEHDRNYNKYKDEYKSGKRIKTPVVKAAVRVVYYDKHALVDQPKSGNDRKWMDEVVHLAIDKLAAEGIHLSPASAQAIWWWPEKMLWERLGVRGKENDTDYAKSLRKLAARKGIAVPAAKKRKKDEA